MKKWMMACAALLLALLCAGALAEETAAGITANVGDIVTFGHYEQDND